MKKKNVMGLTVAFCLVLGALFGCSDASGKRETLCPFTPLTFDSTVENMVEIEGEDYETYNSIYNGMTYTYHKKYLDKDGIIKYMYDDRGKLCNISWAYSDEGAGEVISVYRIICDEVETFRGESVEQDGIGNFTEMWVCDDTTIIVSAVVTDDTKVMQIAYMSPEVSKQNNQSSN